jgi:hypothetical protein
VPLFTTAKAKGWLLPSLPDIVIVILKDPSVEFVDVEVAVAPALTVTPSKGSAPDNTQDIAKLLVKTNLLSLPDLTYLNHNLLVPEKFN